MADLINHPPHYTAGRTEAIDVIEDAILDAPDLITGYSHGQALRYLLRLWHKQAALEDARKARWYLDRLIERLGGEGR
jgi:hypothetical protein